MRSRFLITDEKIIKEIIDEVLSLDSQTIAGKLGISQDAGYWILHILDHTPEFKDSGLSAQEEREEV